MCNEWRDNLWLIVALAVVSLAIWVLLINVWSEIGSMTIPVGADAEDVYTLHVEIVPSESAEYTDYGENKESMEREDRLALMRVIRNSQNVEAAAWSVNALPFNMSFYGYALYLDGEVPDTIGYSGNNRSASPDIVKVLRLRSRTGKTPEQLARYMRENNVLVSNTYSFKSRTPEELLGKSVHLYGDSVNHYRVADVIDFIRRSEYEWPWGGTILKSIDDENPGDVWEIAIRVKPGKGADFMEEFDNTPAMQQHRNLYLSNLTKLTDQRDSNQEGTESTARAFIGMMLLILIVILLGLLGTFWFRVQQRVQEIAIRKVCGATRKAVVGRIMGEGMILLAFATLLTGVIFWVVFKFANLESLNVFSTQETDVIIKCEIATMVIVCFGIILSLWWPAAKAMKIEPAIAIKDE